jgi:drug/metabolite transporter (DMT)-like permease
MFRYILLYTAILLAALGQIFFKLGIRKTDLEGIKFYISLITNIPVILGFACYGVSFILWMYILKYFEVSYARPLMSIGYVFTLICAFFILGEPMTAKKIVGTLVVTVGVFLIK